MEHSTILGRLMRRDGTTYLLDAHGRIHFQNERIWDGYVQHWTGKMVYARYLTEKDYQKGNPIVIMWPYTDTHRPPHIELYYNERLPAYIGSILGHIAINVNGEVFNFSYRLNENEVTTVEEYFYRPALGEFAPHPMSGRSAVSHEAHPYHDNFGRLFMRTVYNLSIETNDLDIKGLSNFFHNELGVIHRTPVDPKKPNIYRGFNILSRSCTTLIRDGFRKMGIMNIKGIAPRDLFINTSYYFFKIREKKGYKMDLKRMNQLKVSEAPYSVITPLLNPMNWMRRKSLQRIYPSFPW